MSVRQNCKGYLQRSPQKIKCWWLLTQDFWPVRQGDWRKERLWEQTHHCWELVEFEPWVIRTRLWENEALKDKTACTQFLILFEMKTTHYLPYNTIQLVIEFGYWLAVRMKTTNFIFFISILHRMWILSTLNRNNVYW